MSKSRLSIVTFRCSRCGLEKPALQFQPVTDAGILIRSDSCAPCCQEIAAIRRGSNGHNGKKGDWR
jgi:hypothetical protein